MRITIQSLFLKIFLWFWAAAIVTGIALVITFIFGPGHVPSRWHSTLTNTARSSGAIVLSELERGGVPAASSYIERFEHDTQLHACLFDLTGTPVVGDDCRSFIDMRSHAARSGVPQFSLKYGLARIALVLRGSAGHDYVFATELPAGPRAALGMDSLAVALRLVIALLVSGLVCYLLAIYLTGPVLRLREATQQLATGNLRARTARSVELRRDELGALATDFNTMAERIEELISRQRQLISDISHELRSPLARLNVALDLAKRGQAGTLPFDYMEKDIEKLNDMILRLLTITRLDMAPSQIEMTCVDLTAIVCQLAEHAQFEAQKRDVAVIVAVQEQISIRGNAELLHSAIENVVRNAVNYTAAGSSVEISLKLKHKSQLALDVRDHGKGVPEQDLGRIFQAFHRVAVARDRESGGVGLGLAIADRVIRIHGGSIRAANREPSGLSVHIELPVLEPPSEG